MSLLNPRRCDLYRPVQDLESCQLLFNLLTTDDFHHEFHRYSSSLILTLLYGKRLVTGREPELEEIENLSSSIVQAVSFGNWAVDAFPFLNFLPRFLSKWKRVGDDFHRRQTTLYTRNAAAALNRTSWSWTKQMTKESDDETTRKQLTFVLGEIFEAGSHTTSGALEVAVLACVSFPDCIKRAQEEFDKVVSNNRLPVFEDVPNLPYMQAFVSEVLRWRPLAPGGVPHAPIQDDTYASYHIPKVAAVVANHWSLDMDEAVFEDPDKFEPDRWLNNADLPLAAFGFGRRTCPGRHLAQSSLLLVISRLLWAFDIKWKNGQEAQLETLEMTHEGVFSKPCRFEAEIIVRSPVYENIVKKSCAGLDTTAEHMLKNISAQF
ncbi:hypothetical protein NLG97_g4078 [Lecanicillium saksenae]|uniref:Uncharacterized protein n=1 Tax=Lecanicillium saksenae TaxID=468837 RepID=A0ACC1QY00_9HYPO|nr:hypothetical protein NLG97_g4078 [Lecanicillium saksenae]